MVYLSNAFSLQMQGGFFAESSPLTLSEAQSLATTTIRDSAMGGETYVETLLTATSVVGHGDIASVMSKALGTTVPMNRVSISLQPGDVLVVGQYVGPRLPEGATTLPEGATIQWYKVEITANGSQQRETEAATAAADRTLALRAQFERAFNMPIGKIDNFLMAENFSTDGGVDEDGRSAMCDEFGLARAWLDAILVL